MLNLGVELPVSHWGWTMFRLVAASRQLVRPQLRLHRRALKISETLRTKGQDAMPKFWVKKMRTMFSAFDVDGDGYVGESDFELWYQRTTKAIPDMPKTRAEMLRTQMYRIWVDYFNDGESPMPGHRVTEEDYIKAMYRVLQQPKLRDSIDRAHGYLFDAVDVNQDGQITLDEHIKYCEALGLRAQAAITSFCAIDQVVDDGVITRDETTSAARDFFLNTSDETRPSKYFMGPLKEE